MNKGLSIYFDFIRVIAAFLVYLYHSNQRTVVVDILPLSNYGHSAVIVFFVLSGYVIAYVSSTKETDIKEYFVSRLSRVYSVALPAIFFTVLLDFIGRFFTNYQYPFDQIVVRILSSIMMLNEFWLVSITPFSNVPYWSITYEFWYYVAFGVACLFSGYKKHIAFFLVLLLLGPKFLLLAPLWYSGVLLYRSNFLTESSLLQTLAIFIFSVFGVLLFHIIDMQTLCLNYVKAFWGEDLTKQLTFSKFFLSDYILCILIVLNFAAARRIGTLIVFKDSLFETSVRWVAGYTFTFYLMHQPLFLFWNSIMRNDPAGYMNWLVVTFCVFLSTYLIGIITEKQRGKLKVLLSTMSNRFLKR